MARKAPRRARLARSARVLSTAAMLLTLLGPMRAEAGVDSKSVEKVTVSFSPGPDALRSIIAELKKAKSTLDVAMYYIPHKDLADLLHYLATRRQVKVRVFVDEDMEAPSRRAFLERLAAGGVDVAVERIRHAGKLHMKCIVIDGKTVITGAANWTKSAFEHNAEDVVVIRSRPIAEEYLKRLTQLKQESEPFDASSGAEVSREIKRFPGVAQLDELRRRPGVPRPADVSAVRDAAVYFSPGRRGIHRLLALAREATKQIDIAMYCMSDRATIAAISQVARAGRCHVRLIADKVMVSSYFLPAAEALWQAGVEVLYVDDPQGTMHLKNIVIDGRYVWTGSANWTKAAFDLNYEDMVLFDSPALAKQYLACQESLAESAKSYGPLSLSAAQPIPQSVSTAGAGGSKMFAEGLPATFPRRDFTGAFSRTSFTNFTVRAQVEYINDGEYLPVLLDLVKSTRQSLLIALYEIPKRKTVHEKQEQVLSALYRAAKRGVYVYMVLHMPANRDDALHQAHSDFAQRLRAEGIDVRFSVPEVTLHTKMVVSDLSKVLIGSHNWSEGALTGKRVYECSALLVLSQQDERFADYVFGLNTVSDMRTPEDWAREISLLTHLGTMSSQKRRRYIQKLRYHRALVPTK